MYIALRRTWSMLRHEPSVWRKRLQPLASISPCCQAIRDGETSSLTRIGWSAAKMLGISTT